MKSAVLGVNKADFLDDINEQLIKLVHVGDLDYDEIRLGYYFDSQVEVAIDVSDYEAVPCLTGDGSISVVDDTSFDYSYTLDKHIPATRQAVYKIEFK